MPGAERDLPLLGRDEVVVASYAQRLSTDKQADESIDIEDIRVKLAELARLSEEDRDALADQSEAVVPAADTRMVMQGLAIIVSYGRGYAGLGDDVIIASSMMTEITHLTSPEHDVQDLLHETEIQATAA